MRCEIFKKSTQILLLHLLNSNHQNKIHKCFILRSSYVATHKFSINIMNENEEGNINAPINFSFRVVHRWNNLPDALKDCDVDKVPKMCRHTAAVEECRCE